MLYAWLMVASLWASLASPLGLQPAPDWILEDEDTPPPARRITPKSVFVAPTFNECGPGYRHDPIAGRCVRIVKVNQKAQWDFFLSRLNAMYAQPTKQKAQSGPLHLALPLDPVVSTTSTTQTVPPTTSTLPPTTTTDPSTVPTTTESPYQPTTTSVPETTTLFPQTTETSKLPSTTNSQYITTKTSPTSATEQTTPTTDLPPSTSTVSSTFPSTPPTTYFTESSQDTTVPYSTTEASTVGFTDTSTYSSYPSETTETFTEYSTYPEPVSIPSEEQHITVKPKRKCPPIVRQVGEYDRGDFLDCETETIRPQYVRFPSPTFDPRRKVGYVRFPDRTWQSSYWWPQNSWDQQRHIPLPSSYQKVQHFPSWQRGRPSWVDSSITA